ncbi:zinc metallochaperone AztD [Aminobacter anthyllidis]|uniref:zinc metallochaperone AztD n=1 Tax=Aminobacter anthyllidis TaxID=1035067 RepID=UPI002453E578|nr:zinc metallochaperone AztD [Aminobacter anthyllidis]MDH4985491.1 zinc metallochaperone AztD [Aminobacter anthyllidis]
MKHLLATTSALAVLLGIAAAPAFAGEQTAWRLFVSDHGAPIIHALDMETGKKIETFNVKAPTSLYRSDSGRTVFAVQGKGNTISVLSSGISFGDHGDHGDIKVEAPRLLDVSFAGKKPSHFVDHDGDIALFFDGEGKTRVSREADILEGKPAIREVATAAPHHGVAVALGEQVLVSEPNVDKLDELPVGIRVVDRAGATVGDVHACPDLHGEASSGNLVAIACAEGLLVTSGDGKIELLPYDKALPAGKSTTLVGGRGLQYFLGNYGPSAVVLIDPKHEDAFRLIDLPTRRVHFTVDPVRAKFAYVFTEDGQLHRIDVVAGKIDASLKLTEPYSMDGHWSDPRPRIAVAGSRIVVSDPLKSVLHVVDAESFKQGDDIALEGKPFNLVAVGGSGETH